jgi:hypothetical protein
MERTGNLENLIDEAEKILEIEECRILREALVRLTDVK